MSFPRPDLRTPVKTQRQKTIELLRQWLKPQEISFLRRVKSEKGTINTCITEEINGKPVLHPIGFREGMRIRAFLRTLQLGWTEAQYNEQWAGLVEEAIQ